MAGRVAPAADAPSEERGALTLLLAPFVHGALFTLLRLAGLDAVLAARALALTWGVIATGCAMRARAGSAEAAWPAWPAWGVAGGCEARAGVGADALARARDALGRLVPRRRGVGGRARAPARGPVLRRLPAALSVGEHAGCASWLVLAPSLPAWAPLLVASTLAGVATLLAVGALARALGGSARVSAFAQALALAGTAPFAWLTLASRAASGELRGIAELRHSLGRGADLALYSLDPGLLHPSLVLPLDKFMVVTPFTWGLAGVVIVALCLRSVLASDPAGTRFRAGLVRLACAIAAVGFVHPLAGVACAGAVVVSVCVAGDWRTRRGVLARTVIAALAGLAVITPYLWQVSAGGIAVATHASVSFAPRGLVSAAYAGAFAAAARVARAAGP